MVVQSTNSVTKRDKTKLQKRAENYTHFNVQVPVGSRQLLNTEKPASVQDQAPAQQTFVVDWNTVNLMQSSPP